MKKQILLAAIAAVFSIVSVSAQPQGGQRKTIEERVKDIDDKLVDFKLDKDKAGKVDDALTAYFKGQQKMMEDMRAAGGQPDRDAIKASRQKLADERDAKLKLVFTDDQYKKWKDEIEPSTRSQRGGGQQPPQQQ